jgi:hypothetical protein
MARRLQLPLLLFLLFARLANNTTSTGYQYILWNSCEAIRTSPSSCWSALSLFFSDTDLWRLFPDATDLKDSAIHVGRSYEIFN